jgi:signal transduction histidine kinase
MNQTPQEAKDDFLALASHQLRTPATGVKQYLGMLKEGLAGPMSDLQTKLVNKAYESNERQLGIINEMLFVARADSGQIKIQSDLIDLNSLLEDIVEEQQVAFRNKRQIKKMSLPEQRVLFVGDSQYLRMAFENLISNATKYTHEGGKIEINLHNGIQDIVIEVCDTGVGVAEEDRELLFKKFARISNELSAIVSGSGLGLYLVKKVIEAHSGRIEFHSKVGVGSKVKIVLPKNSKFQK